MTQTKCLEPPKPRSSCWPVALINDTPAWWTVTSKCRFSDPPSSFYEWRLHCSPWNIVYPRRHYLCYQGHAYNPCPVFCILESVTFRVVLILLGEKWIFSGESNDSIVDSPKFHANSANIRWWSVWSSEWSFPVFLYRWNILQFTGAMIEWAIWMQFITVVGVNLCKAQLQHRS